jgi:hypothetical protein
MKEARLASTPSRAPTISRDPNILRRRLRAVARALVGLLTGVGIDLNGEGHFAILLRVSEIKTVV